MVLSYNHFLHLGFWNFCAGIPLTLATLAYVSAGSGTGPARPSPIPETSPSSPRQAEFTRPGLRREFLRRERPLYGGRFATLLALALATYLCHPIAWGMAVLGTTWILAWEQFGVPPLKSVLPFRSGF